jgi:hypothetical protein
MGSHHVNRRRDACRMAYSDKGAILCYYLAGAAIVWARRLLHIRRFLATSSGSSIRAASNNIN